MEILPSKSNAIRAILTAWLVVGILDITSAVVIWLTRGMGPARGLQGIAAGFLGARSYEGGLVTAVLGLTIHFFVALVVVSLFFAVSRKLPFLTAHAVMCGILYGVAVYLVMYWFVLPTTFATFRHRLSNDLLAVAIHICLIGLPTALIVRQFARDR